ncbi:MAG: signal peptidase II [Eubacteriales bacterium]|nr:signal peptidase II [Eubacteriales bacterium]
MSDKRDISAAKWIVMYLFAVVILVLADQLTKYLAVLFLKGQDPVSVLPGILLLLYTENTGAAFGILKGKQWFFYAVALIVVIGVTFFLSRLPRKKRYLPLYLDFCFIAAGAIGNVIDRMRLGYVVDFIYFKPIDFPVFNVADIYITCACAVLVFLFMFYYKEDELRF